MLPKQKFTIRCCFILGFLCLVSPFAHADGGDKDSTATSRILHWRNLYNWTAGASVHAGAMMNHHNNMHILAEEHPFLVDAFFARKTHGEQAWQSFFNYPDYGIAVTMIDFGSPDYLGNAYSIYPFMRFYLFKRYKPVNLCIGAGGGIGYVEKTFNNIDNYKNVAVGSHLNAFLRLQLQLNVRLSPRIDLFGGLSLSHLSNGSFKKPNAGVNMASASVGASYAFGESGPHSYIYPIYSETNPRYGLDKHWSYSLYLLGGVKEISPIGSNKYFASSLSLEASRQHLDFTRFGGTLDVFYDFSDYQNMVNEGYEGLTRLQMVKVGLTAGYELQFGKRVSANIQVGAYLYAKEKENGITYQRYALRYAVTDRLKVHFGLKSQLGSADYVEMGLGYKLR